MYIITMRRGFVHQHKITDKSLSLYPIYSTRKGPSQAETGLQSMLFKLLFKSMFDKWLNIR
jgi:hypothetical protein